MASVFLLALKCFARNYPAILEDGENELPMLTRTLFNILKQRHDSFNEKIDQLEKEIHSWHQQNAISLQLATIPGIGVLSATALAATIGDVHNFKNARQLAAYLGLVPRQHSSGGKDKLLGISKRGDGYVRSTVSAWCPRRYQPY